ncbi:alginate O-acetyltransferase AlgX-related protein [Leadbettera azotonutricia]|uniref:alginate O-acetyltransferase AlgX-related protein n=1 Tax=Leadbettera azotonutricia TaxID=150829 RepID=UPI0002FE723A|nr:hypothetical protein [Leadbettera azotonutricia]
MIEIDSKAKEAKQILLYEMARRQTGILLVVMMSIFSLVNGVWQFVPTLWTGIVWSLQNATGPTELKGFLSAVESNLGGDLLGKNQFIEFYAFMEKLQGKEESDNFWAVKNKAGDIMYSNFYPDNVDSLGECVRRIWRLKQTVAQTGTKVFFVMPPTLYIRGKEDFSPGLPYGDYNYREDTFLYWLDQFGIDNLDLRESLKDNNIAPEDYFFHTDHHWRLETSFAAFGDIVAWLDETFGVDLDPDRFYTDISNYYQRTYENASLGSFGRKTGIIFSGLDDFTVLWPKFDDQTDFTYYPRFLLPYSQPISGPFTESLLYPRLISTENPYINDFYGVYQSGIKSHEKIINNKNPDLPKMLLIRDSFSLPLGVFMAPLFSQIDCIWPANSDNFFFDIDAYLQENHFDFIMIEMYQENLITKNFYYNPNSLPNEPFSGGMEQE